MAISTKREAGSGCDDCDSHGQIFFQFVRLFVFSKVLFHLNKLGSKIPYGFCVGLLVVGLFRFWICVRVTVFDVVGIRLRSIHGKMIWRNEKMIGND